MELALGAFSQPIPWTVLASLLFLMMPDSRGKRPREGEEQGKVISREASPQTEAHHEKHVEARLPIHLEPGSAPSSSRPTLRVSFSGIPGDKDAKDEEAQQRKKEKKAKKAKKKHKKQTELPGPWENLGPARRQGFSEWGRIVTTDGLQECIEEVPDGAHPADQSAASG